MEFEQKSKRRILVLGRTLVKSNVINSIEYSRLSLTQLELAGIFA